jgi:hypothetical protein
VIRFWVLAAIAVTLLGTGSASAQKRDEKLSVEQTNKLLTDQTLMFHDKAHGTSIQYLARRGILYMFDAGSKTVRQGTWGISHSNKYMPVAMCFTPGGSELDPFTRKPGGALQCLNAVDYRKAILDRADGDVFGLSKQQAVPFKLSPKQTTIARLKEQHP